MRSILLMLMWNAHTLGLLDDFPDRFIFKELRPNIESFFQEANNSMGLSIKLKFKIIENTTLRLWQNGAN